MREGTGQHSEESVALWVFRLSTRKPKVSSKPKAASKAAPATAVFVEIAAFLIRLAVTFRAEAGYLGAVSAQVVKSLCVLVTLVLVCKQPPKNLFLCVSHDVLGST